MTPEADPLWEIWRRWLEGLGRCPYCLNDDETFHTVCDCPYHDQTCDIEGCLGK
jgi:hypothetical protein